MELVLDLPKIDLNDFLKPIRPHKIPTPEELCSAYEQQLEINRIRRAISVRESNKIKDLLIKGNLRLLQDYAKHKNHQIELVLSSTGDMVLFHVKQAGITITAGSLVI